MEQMAQVLFEPQMNRGVADTATCDDTNDVRLSVAHGK